MFVASAAAAADAAAALVVVRSWVEAGLGLEKVGGWVGWDQDIGKGRGIWTGNYHGLYSVRRLFHIPLVVSIWCLHECCSHVPVVFRGNYYERLINILR